MEQQRFMQIYKDRALQQGGVAIGGLSLGGAKGVPARCPKGTHRVCELGKKPKAKPKTKKAIAKRLEKALLQEEAALLKEQKALVKSRGKGAIHGLHMGGEGVMHSSMHTTHKRQNPWVDFLKEYAAVHGLTYAEAMKVAKDGGLRQEYMMWKGNM